MGLFNRKKKISVDFATVDSPDKAESLVKQGVLTRVLLVPPQRGGLEDSLNAVYATPKAAKEKARCDAEVWNGLSAAAGCRDTLATWSMTRTAPAALRGPSP